jgi:tetratricopeptide (TPR) repeat protein
MRFVFVPRREREPLGMNLFLLRWNRIEHVMMLVHRMLRVLAALLVVLSVGVCLDAGTTRIRAQGKQQETKIAGTVCNVAGEGIVGATLWLQHDADTAALEVVTGADGKYEFVVGGGGRYKLKVMKDGFRDAGVDPIQVNEGGIKKVDVILEKEGAKAEASAGANSDSNGSASSQASGKAMEFSDEPNFAVAGVTDWSNVGLHGSDANVKTSETLVKETAALKAGAVTAANVTAGAPSEGDAHRLAGDGKEKSGDPVAAVNEYEKAAKLEPSEENYFAWGTELLKHRAGVATVEVFKKGVELHPKSARMRAGLGAAYYADGQFGEAAELMCEAADLNPADAAPYLFLGKMEDASNDGFACSEERLAEFVNGERKNAQANYYYGLVLWKKGRKEQNAEEIALAEVFFRRALAIDANFGEVYVQLGMLYNARGQKEPSLLCFERAVAVSPRLSAAHYQLSLAYRRAGDAEKADQQMKVYDELKRAEDAALEKQRREMRQFVTILKDGAAPAPK